MAAYPRYESPYFTANTRGEEDVAPLFERVHVELTPAPEPIHLVAHTRWGDLTGTYDPAPLVAEIILFYAWLLCPPVTALTEYMETNHCGKSEAKGLLAGLYCDRMRMCVGTACNYAMRQSEDYLRRALASIHDDAVDHTFAVRNGEAFKVEPVEGLIKRKVGEQRRRLKSLVGLPTHGGKRNFDHDWPDEDCVRLAALHSRLHPLWKSAKAIYKRNPTTYREEIQNALLFSSAKEIERVADPDPYVSSPSNLALVSASLVIGLRPGQYSIRQLRRYLKKGRVLAGAKEFWTVKVWL